MRFSPSVLQDFIYLKKCTAGLANPSSPLAAVPPAAVIVFSSHANSTSSAIIPTMRKTLYIFYVKYIME